MKTTGIKVTEVSIEAMLSDKENSSYNQSTWIEAIERIKKYRSLKFYKAAPSEGYKYDRFFVSYIIPEGLFLLKSFSPFCAALSNRGFTRVHISEGEIMKNIFTFPDNTEGVISNTKEGRKWLVDNICSKGVMVSSEF